MSRPFVQQVLGDARRERSDDEEEGRRKSRLTTRRKQNRDELEAKTAAKEAHQKALKEGSTKVQAPCGKCVLASDSQFDAARDMLAEHLDLLRGATGDEEDEEDQEEVTMAHRELMANDEVYAELFNGAKARLATAHTHSRASNHECIAYMPRQRVKTKQRAGGVTMRSFTIKNGLTTLLQPDIPQEDKTKFLDGMQKVVEYNRLMVIHAMAFVQHYIIAQLSADRQVPRALFDSSFFYGVFQLLLGQPFTNKTKFNDAERAAILDAFRLFQHAHPAIHLDPVPSEHAKPCMFSEVLSASAQQLATHMKSHVVENFDTFYTNYLAASLARSLVQEGFDDVKPHITRGYAAYAYQRSVHDDDHPAEAPAYKMDARLKERIVELSDALVPETEAVWRRVAGYIADERRAIALAKQARQAAATRGQAARELRRTRQFGASSSTGAQEMDVDVDEEDPSSDNDDNGVDEAEEDVISVSTEVTVGSMGASNLSVAEIPPVIRVTTSAITQNPQFFLKVMYEILVMMENWNDSDALLPATPQDEVYFPWVRHVLHDLLDDDFKKLDHRKRTYLTRTVVMLINKDIEPNASRLSRSISSQGRQLVVQLVEDVQLLIREHNFIPHGILVRSSLRLFALVPVPSMRLRYIHVTHRILKTILGHFGLKDYNKGKKTVPADGTPHEVFELFDMTKLKRCRASAFENAFDTDGYATSFTFKRPKGEAPTNLTLENVTRQHLGQCRAWGVDPGVDEIFVGVDGSSYESGIYSATPLSIPPPPADRTADELALDADDNIILHAGPARRRPRSVSAPPLAVQAMQVLMKPDRKRAATVDGRPCDANDPLFPRSRRDYIAHPTHEVRRFSPKEYNEMAGIPMINAWLEQRKVASDIVAIESQIPTAKTARSDRADERVRALLQALPTLLSFYDMQHQAKRFSLYRGKQKAGAEMVNIFLGGGIKYTRPNQNTQRLASAPTATRKWRAAPFSPNAPNITPLIFLGNGQFGRRTWRGKPHGHAKKLRKLLSIAQRKGNLLVVSVDEAWTSQVCSRCGRRSMSNIPVLPLIGPSYKLHGVLKCQSCSTLWQRDANAARNIHAIATLNVLGRHLHHIFKDSNPSSRPLAFTRANAIPPPPSRAQS